MNITLSADEELIRRAREMARRQGKSLNQVVREFLAHYASSNAGSVSAARLFALMDEAGGSSKGKRWTRDELHER